MELRLLGPVEAFADGVRVPLGRRQERLLLAILALHPGSFHSIEHLADLLWADGPPASTRGSVQAMVSHLRSALRSLGPDAPRLCSQNGGYLLELEPGAVDLHRFRRLVGQAHTAGSPRLRMSLLDEALALWRGPFLADLIEEQERFRLFGDIEESQLTAREEWLECQIELGWHRRVVEPLTKFVGQHPLRERAVALLMLALYRCGRASDAVSVYVEFVAGLREELGLDPGRYVSKMYTAILRDDPELLGPAEQAPGTADYVYGNAGYVSGTGQALSMASAVTPPAQLPAVPAYFIGRDPHLRLLDALIESPETPAGTVVSVISGSAGVGKTALAVAWADRVRERFPDGQLFVNLRGYSRTPRLRPIEVLTQILVGLGVPPSQVPLDLDQAVGLYRTLTAGKRLLIVLDNAGGPDQVRPALPGSRDSLVLVTSRDSLAGLVAKEGAHPLTLDVLVPDQALDLLRHLVGKKRVDSRLDDALALAAACGYLPLALRIAAAKLLDEPEMTFAEYGEALLRGRLDALAVAGDDEATVRAAFDLSYERLAADTAGVFRLLGLVPGIDLAPEALAALGDVENGRVERVLAELAAAHLVEVGPDGRYAQHDLLRAYAAQRGAAIDSPAKREAALLRLLRWYLSHLSAATDVLYPGTPKLPHDAPAAAPFSGWAAARDWLDREHETLVKLVVLGAQARLGTAAVIGDYLRRHMWVRRAPLEWLTIGRAALSSARAAGESGPRGSAHHNLGLAYQLAGDCRSAVAHLRRAIRLYHHAKLRTHEAFAVGSIGTALGDLGDLAAAEAHLRRAASLHQRQGDVQGLAVVQANLGMTYLLTGRLRLAVDSCSAALLGYRSIGARCEEATVLNNMGLINIYLARFDDARACLSAAAQASRDVGWSVFECLVMIGMTQLRCEQGRLGEATEYAKAVMELAPRLGDGFVEADGMTWMGQVERLRGQPHAAIGSYLRALDGAVATRAIRIEARALIGLALSQMDIGRSDAAYENAVRALATARRGGLRLLECEAQQALAEIHRRRGELDRAIEPAHRALEFAEQAGYVLGAARARLVLGQVLPAPTGAVHLRKILDMLPRMDTLERRAALHLLPTATVNG